MATETTAHTEKRIFAPGTVVKNRGRLWRVDGQDYDVRIATTIDTGEPEQSKSYCPFEDIKPGRPASPSPGIVGYPTAQGLLLRAYRLSLPLGTAPFQSEAQRMVLEEYEELEGRCG